MIPDTTPDMVITALAQPAGDAAYDRVTITTDTLMGTAAGRIEDNLGGVSGFQQFRRTDSRAAKPTSQGATLRAIGGNASSGRSSSSTGRRSPTRSPATSRGSPSRRSGWRAFAPPAVPARERSARRARRDDRTDQRRPGVARAGADVGGSYGSVSARASKRRREREKNP